MMLSGIPNLLFQAVRFQNPNKDALRAFTDSEWDTILSNWQTVRILLSLRLDRGDDLPAWVRHRIDQYLSDTALRFERVMATYSTVATALRKVGADHVVIKGF